MTPDPNRSRHRPFSGRPLILPAIDLRGGRVVRLIQGEGDAEIDYSERPLDTARRWIDAGACCLHIIDLGGALGEPDSLAVIEDIAANLDVPIQTGGGVRDDAAVERLLRAGVSRVLLGTRALRDGAFLNRVISRHGPERIVLAMDMAGGRVKVSGWTEASSLDLAGGMAYAVDHGVTTLLVTAIDRDGTLSGPDRRLVDETLTLAAQRGLDVVVAGGIGGPDHIRGVMDLGSPALQGVVVGRALYEGNVDLSAAVALARQRGGG